VSGQGPAAVGLIRLARVPERGTSLRPLRHRRRLRASPLGCPHRRDLASPRVLRRGSRDMLGGLDRRLRRAVRHGAPVSACRPWCPVCPGRISATTTVPAARMTPAIRLVCATAWVKAWFAAATSRCACCVPPCGLCATCWATAWAPPMKSFAVSSACVGRWPEIREPRVLL